MAKPHEESTWLDQIEFTPLKKGDREALRLALNLSYKYVTKCAFIGECTHPKTMSCGVLFSAIAYVLTYSLISTVATFFVIISVPGLIFVTNTAFGLYHELADIRKENYGYWINNKEKVTKFWVACYRGELAGTAAVEMKEDKIANVIRVAVVPKFGGKGLGRKLMSVCHEFCSDLKCHKMKLATTSYQPMAINMYQKLGYKEVNKRKIGLAFEVVTFEYEL